VPLLQVSIFRCRPVFRYCQSPGSSAALPCHERRWQKSGAPDSRASSFMPPSSCALNLLLGLQSHAPGIILVMLCSRASFCRLSGSAALATGTVDGGATSGQTNTATASAAGSEHGCVPASQVVSRRSPFLQHFPSYLSISGTINRRTCEPRMYTRSRWVTLPSRWVTLMFSICTFMLSSAAHIVSLFLAPVANVFLRVAHLQ
jgi:hypothetical protein